MGTILQTGEMVRILSGNRVYEASGSHDPIWGEFIPLDMEDGEDIELDGELSEIVNQEFDNYVRLRNMLEGAAYYTFNVGPKTNADMLRRNILASGGYEQMDPDEWAAAHPMEWRDVVSVARRAAFTVPAPTGFSFPRFTSCGEIDGNEVCGTVLWRDVGSRRLTMDISRAPTFSSDAAVTYDLLLLVRPSESEIVYYDQIWRITRFLPLPLGWEYWVPTRYVPDSPIPADMVANHLVRVGELNVQFNYLRLGMMTFTPRWRGRQDPTHDMPPWTVGHLLEMTTLGEIEANRRVNEVPTILQLYVNGVTVLAPMRGVESAASTVPLDAAGIYWRELYDVSLAASDEYLRDVVLESVGSLLHLGDYIPSSELDASLVPRHLPRQKSEAETALLTRLTLEYPDDINPRDLGLGYVLGTEGYDYVNNRRLPGFSAPYPTYERRLYDYLPYYISRRLSGASPAGIDPDDLRSYGATTLSDLPVAVREKILLSLSNWLASGTGTGEEIERVQLFLLGAEHGRGRDVARPLWLMTGE